VHLTIAHATHCLSASPTTSTSTPRSKGAFTPLHMSRNVPMGALDCSWLHVYSFVNVAITAWHVFCNLAIVLGRDLGPIVRSGQRSCHDYAKKNALPSVSFRCTLDRSFSGLYSSHTLAGNMCLFLSYHLRSTTLVRVGSSSNPSSSSSGTAGLLSLLWPGLSRGLKVAGSASGPATGVAFVGCAEYSKIGPLNPAALLNKK
jgi:hypothetical protein